MAGIDVVGLGYAIIGAKVEWSHGGGIALLQAMDQL